MLVGQKAQNFSYTKWVAFGDVLYNLRWPKLIIPVNIYIYIYIYIFEIKITYNIVFILGTQQSDSAIDLFSVYFPLWVISRYWI